MSVFLWGAGSQARVVESMLADQGLQVKSIFDSTLKEPKFLTEARFSNLLTDLPELIQAAESFYICIGSEYGFSRYGLMAEIKRRYGRKLLSIISPDAFIDPTADVGEGFLAMPGAIVQKFVRVGEGVIVNTGAQVDHESELGDGAHIMPGAVLAGRVKVENFATVGSNATILPNLKIGAHAYVAAGAVVSKDVADKAIVVGAPAKFTRERVPVEDSTFARLGSEV